MMADDRAQGEGRNGGGSGEQEQPLAYAKAAYALGRAYEYARVYAHARALVSLALKGSGLVALSLSTVILLGGFVSSLERRDFFSITVISVIQAAGIFQDWENNLDYLIEFLEIFELQFSRIVNLTLTDNVKGNFLIYYITSPVMLPCLVLVLCVQLLYLLGPLACAAISSWCIAKLNNHGNRVGTDSMADMMAALNIFYALIILQGTMFLVLLLPMNIYGNIVTYQVSCICSLDQLSKKWSINAIRKYVIYISSECRKDSLSIKGMDLIKYAAVLLDSEFQEDYLCGARLLGAFIKKGEDVRWLLLPSSHKVQKLIDSLRISSSLDENTEIRELAAVIVAHLAAHVDLAKYPGALGCISSVFQEETRQTYWNISKQASDPRPPQDNATPFKMLFQSKEKRIQTLIREEEARQWRLMRDQKRLRIGEERRQENREGGINNELIQQGLTILERLAFNSDNRRLICNAPGLLVKITGPFNSATFIEDVKTKAWADIVTMCLKVLYQLIHAPGRPSRRVRRKIFSNPQALSNLKSILEPGHEPDHQELKLRAMEILTELALDLTINLTEETKKVLIRKQLKLFLANGDGEESAVIAGRTLVSLSTNSESNSALIKASQNDIIGLLTEIIDNKDIITQRTIAAEIMANLCAHSHCNVEDMKEILLPKVLTEIMSMKTKTEDPQPRISAEQNNPASGDEENQGDSVSINNEEIMSITEDPQPRISAEQNNPASGDAENQGNSVSINNEERHSISTHGSYTEIEEISDQEMEEQEAFLSLALVICDKLNSADLDAAIRNNVLSNAGSEEQSREALVDKLKTIIDDNCRRPIADSLRIVKLCSLIAESIMMRCQQYVEHVRNKGVKNSLSKAKKTMSELESCMLFVGTDFGLKKTVRPLLSEIEKKWSDARNL